MTSEATAKIEWKETITPSHNIFYLNLRELWRYRDLLMIWVKRDISAVYKQTILGPIWFFLQPLLTTIIYIIIFSRVARFSTGGLPPTIFYLSGIILWAYFSECIVKTASFLKENSSIFSKVYFPRLVIPLSIILSNLIKFAIQFVLFIIIYIYFLYTSDWIQPTYYIFLFPLLIIAIALLGFGAGIIIASLTIRYKDLAHLIAFGIQLMMFVSPVFFPIDSMEDGSYKTIILANPMSGIIEFFRFMFTGKGHLDWYLLGYDLLCMMAFLILGIALFNHSEKKFVDTI